MGARRGCSSRHRGQTTPGPGPSLARDRLKPHRGQALAWLGTGSCRVATWHQPGTSLARARLGPGPGVRSRYHWSMPDAFHALEETVTSDVTRALREDVGLGDLTARLIPEGKAGQARLLTRQSGVLCG